MIYYTHCWHLKMPRCLDWLKFRADLFYNGLKLLVVAASLLPPFNKVSLLMHEQGVINRL
jgi:hypothetical protein